MLWVYNGLDCTNTAEIFEKIHPQLDSTTSKTYDFNRAMQAPALEMMLRGMKVDESRRQEALFALEDRGYALDKILEAYGNALQGQPLNPNSRKQVFHCLHEVLRLPVQYKYDRKEKKEKIALDREALEKLSDSPVANPVILAMLAKRDIVKKVSVLRSGIDPDGRMRVSYNVAGTETGRWSSSQNIYKGGMNAQNITEEIRPVFIADPGKKLCYLDLEQAESKAVAFLSKDSAYRDACNSGDLHTTVARLVWPERPWTGDAVKDRELADQVFYRHFSYRDMSKRGGHGTNYLGTPRTMAKHLKVETQVIAAFQRNYFSAFPGLPRWHDGVAKRIQTTGEITTCFGRRRKFLSRVWDSSTIREAVAHEPQSMIGDYLNRGMLLCWYLFPQIELWAQIHDAFAFQYDEGNDEICFEVAKTVATPWLGFACPTDIAVGWNLGKFSEKNPHGLKKLKPGKPDLRSAPNYVKPSPFAILDRRFS